MKIKAAQLIKEKQIVINEIESEELKDNEVKIVPKYVGVCGSDLHFFEHGRIGKCIVRYPFVLGHECSGTVIDKGKDVKEFEVGDKVVLEPGVPCGTCNYCKQGRYNLCPDVKFLSTPPFDGVLREEVNHPADMVYHLPENISMMQAALIEPLAVGLYASKRGNVKPGDRVAVLGGGCIGFMTLLACKAAGASEIIVSDLFDNRLAQALELGATGIFNPLKDGDTDVMNKKYTGGNGFDVVFETAGSKITASQTGYLVKRGGVIVMVGNIVDDVQFSFRNLYLKEADVKAVFRYRNVFKEAIWQLESGRIDLSKLNLDLFDFENVQEAFEKAMNDKKHVIKAVIGMK